MLYLHIPFCIRKCRYCDFLSAPADEATRSAYVAALMEEIRRKAPGYREYVVPSVYFGGGTPSLLTGGQIASLLSLLREHFQIQENAEITLEGNPGTFEWEQLLMLREAGINRISIGLQSAHDRELRLLGRIHDYSTFLSCYEMALSAGFQNMNLDLIYALPGQSLADWEETLREAIRLQPAHISAYNLILEEGTPFFETYRKAALLRSQGKHCGPLPTEEEELLMFERAGDILEEAGYHRYEISNYAREGFSCRHNLGYWNRENYLGLGIGAASLIENVRYKNSSDLDVYLRLQYAWDTAEPLSVKAQMEEFMFLGLRLTEGVSCERFSECFGCGLETVYGPVLTPLMEEGLLIPYAREGGAWLRLSLRGVELSNYVMSRFLLS